MKRALTTGITIGPYSPAIIVKGLAFVSGQGGLDPETMALVGDGVTEQTGQTMKNIAAILSQGGMTTDDIVSVTCYIIDIDDWPAMNDEYVKHFSGKSPLPSRTAVAVSALPAGVRVEITCIAQLPDPGPGVRLV
jgi:2-iminobutanoate/2-iminopropanoate deaminase